MHAADFWDEALNIDDYLARMTQRRDEYDRGIESTVITPELRLAFGVRSLRFLALTEDYCGDSAQFIPPIMRLSRELDNVEVRVLLRNSHRDLAAGYVRKDGYQPIPVLILLDGDGNELGALIERPARMYDEMAAETRRFALEHPELEGVNRNYKQMPQDTLSIVIANMDRYRAQHIERYLRWLWEDLAAIVTQAPVREATTAD